MSFLEKLQSKNRDYAAAAPLTAVFLGDSVTHGAFETIMLQPDRMDCHYEPDQAYHAQLKRLIQTVAPKVPLNIINAGVGGDGTTQGLARLERDVLAFHPDLVVICFGLNDVGGGAAKLDVFIDNLRRMFQMVKQTPADLIYMTPNSMNSYVSGCITDPALRQIAARTAALQNEGMMDCYMEAARQLCADEQVTLCDCYRQWRLLAAAGIDTTMLLANHINHPTRKMHQLFASALFDLLMFPDGNRA